MSKIHNAFAASRCTAALAACGGNPTGKGETVGTVGGAAAGGAIGHGGNRQHRRHGRRRGRRRRRSATRSASVTTISIASRRFI